MGDVARTDKDRPSRLRGQDGDQSLLRGPGFRLNCVRPEWKRARQKARAVLRQGAEPEPTRHRHSALWDRW
jgi:hypothetical protein